MLLLLALAACSDDPPILTELDRRLVTTEATFDANLVAVGDAYPLSIILASTAGGPVTVREVRLEDESDPAWSIDPEWHVAVTESSRSTDWDEDGKDDSLVIDGGSESSPSYGVIEVMFTPAEPGLFRQTLQIVSNDSLVTERDPDNEDLGIWTVALRGIAEYPTGKVWPAFVDFGAGASGATFMQSVIVTNTSNVKLTVEDWSIEGSEGAFELSSPLPMPVLPNNTEVFNVLWFATDTVDQAQLALITNGPEADTMLELIGNNCELSVHEDYGDDDCEKVVEDAWVDDDGDGFSEREGDCDDNFPQARPGGIEIDNGYDDNCDGRVDEGFDSYDDDGDGFTEDEGDCDDIDPWSYPDAGEDCDFRDNDCDGQADEDGACDDVPGHDSADTGATGGSGGTCSSTPAPLWLWGLGLLGALGRRRG